MCGTRCDGDFQARAVDLAEMHKKEVEVKRVRAISQREKHKLEDEKAMLEEDYQEEIQTKKKEDVVVEAKIQVGPLPKCYACVTPPGGSAP
jgi:hypothetical protein